MAYKLIEAAQSLWRRQLAHLVGAQLARDLRKATLEHPDETTGQEVVV